MGRHHEAWDATTNSVSLLTGTPTASLDSLMFDPQGNIVYDSFGGSTVWRYNFTTHFNTPVTGPFAGPADMTIIGADDIAPVAGLGSQSVPEPGSLGLLAAGLAVLGTAKRRRWRSR